MSSLLNIISTFVLSGYSCLGGGSEVTGCADDNPVPTIILSQMTDSTDTSLATPLSLRTRAPFASNNENPDFKIPTIASVELQAFIKNYYQVTHPPKFEYETSGNPLKSDIEDMSQKEKNERKQRKIVFRPL